jgi:hypothetical protein
MAPRAPLSAALALAVAGCASPAPFSDFAGAPPQQVRAGGSEFSVRVAGGRARAVRTDFDPQAGIRGRRIVPRAGLAMERASGCRVVPGTLTGDAAVIEAELAC